MARYSWWQEFPLLVEIEVADFDEPTPAFDMRFIGVASSFDGHHQHAFVRTLDAQLRLLHHHAKDVVDALHECVLDVAHHVDEGECASDILATTCIVLELWSKHEDMDFHVVVTPGTKPRASSVY